MSKHSEQLVRLSINKLMWDKLAVAASEYESPSNFCYAGGMDALVINMSLSHYAVLLSYADKHKHQPMFIGVQRLIVRIVDAKT